MRARGTQRMLKIVRGMARNELMKISVGALLVAGCGVFALPLAAQRQGPLPPPPPGTVVIGPAEPAKTNSAPQQPASHLTNEPQQLPVDQIIQKFTQHEEEFRKERENYTYTQFIMFQTIDSDGQVDGEYRMTSDILFTPAGKRYGKVIEAPASSIQRLTMEKQNFDYFNKEFLLVLTPEERPKYTLQYLVRSPD